MRGGGYAMAALGSALLTSALLITAGCGSTQKSASNSPTPAQAMFGQVKSLAGTWEGKDPEGNAQKIVYRVVSNGSAVCEQMFPGQPHEMVNMYHLDGDRLLVTHYCAMGNQPRMAARAQPVATEIIFQPESVTNLADPAGDYMASLKLVMPDPDHLTQCWTSYENGKPGHTTEFTLTRARS